MDYEFDPDGRGLHLRLTEAEARAVHTLATSAAVPDREFIAEMLFSPILEAKADLENWLEQRLREIVSLGVV